MEFNKSATFLVVDRRLQAHMIYMSNLQQLVLELARNINYWLCVLKLLMAVALIACGDKAWVSMRHTWSHKPA